MVERWLVTGAGGQLGSVLLGRLVGSGRAALGLASLGGPLPHRGECRRADITDSDALAAVVREAKPAIIVHCAAVIDVNAAFHSPDLARRTNVEATARLTELAAEMGARLAFVSTDLVFDGTAAPYAEDAPPQPLSVYGRTKVEAEGLVAGYSRGVIVRPPLMYGVPAASRQTTFLRQLAAIREGTELRLFTDEFRTPMALVDAADAVIAAAGSEVTGTLHIAGPQRLSRLEMGLIAARAMGCADERIVAIEQRDVASPEPRPADVSLDCGMFTRVFGKPPGRSMSEAMHEIAAQFLSGRGA
jgi:dTDP-4-dehydrorhamnose reductase